MTSSELMCPIGKHAKTLGLDGWRPEAASAHILSENAVVPQFHQILSSAQNSSRQFVTFPGEGAVTSSIKQSQTYQPFSLSGGGQNLCLQQNRCQGLILGRK